MSRWHFEARTAGFSNTCGIIAEERNPMAEREKLPQAIADIVTDAAPVVSQESEAKQRLEEKRGEMSKLMEQLENERATKGNFAVTVAYEGDTDTRNVAFIQPVRTSHYSEFRQGTVIDPTNSTAVSRPLEATTFTFACKDGFRTIVLNTEDVPRNNARITSNQPVQGIADSLQTVLASAAARDSQIILPAPQSGEQRPFPIYKLMKQSLGLKDEDNSLRDNIHVGFYDGDRDPQLVVNTLKSSIEAAQTRHKVGITEANQASANLSQTISAVRDGLTK